MQAMRELSWSSTPKPDLSHLGLFEGGEIGSRQVSIFKVRFDRVSIHDYFYHVFLIRRKWAKYIILIETFEYKARCLGWDWMGAWMVMRTRHRCESDGRCPYMGCLCRWIPIAVDSGSMLVWDCCAQRGETMPSYAEDRWTSNRPCSLGRDKNWNAWMSGLTTPNYWTKSCGMIWDVL